ncbi:MAG: BamA/TamA family outer membrane protein [Flavobacteriaceae bacterium]
MILLFLAVVIYSCSSTKKLAKEEQLIIKQSFVINDEVVNQDPVTVLSQTPENSNVFGIPYKLHLYNLAKPAPDERFDAWVAQKPQREKKLNKWLSPKQLEQLKQYKIGFSNWLKKNGEPPSLVDPEKIALTNSLFKQYYNNLGYFNSTATATIINEEAQKASIRYNITTGPRFTLDSISSIAASKDIDSIYRAHQKKSLLQKDQAFKVEDITAERDRLINLFRNNGIFNFQQRSIRFKAFKDSLGKDTKIPLVIEIKNAQKRVQDTLVEVPYKLQKINALSIYVENPEQEVSVYTDSISYNGLNIYSVGALKYKPEVLAKGISISTNAPYSYQDRTATYRYFNELQNFKYPTITYSPVENEPSLLDANVILSPKERFSLGFDFDVSHSNIQDIGITLGTAVISRNVFRGAEILEFGIKSTVGSSRDVAEQKSSFFNLFEIGGNLLLRVPRSLAPKKINDLFFTDKNVKTNIALGINLQENIGLDRQSFTGNFEYQWKTKLSHTFTFKLADIEYVDNRAIDNYFNVYRNSYDRLNTVAKTLTQNNPYLNEEGDLPIPFVADTFINDVLNERTIITNEDQRYTVVSTINERKNRLTANNFIVGSSFNFLKNNQESLFDESFSQFRLKLEWVGNVLNGLLSLTDAPKDDEGNRYIFNLAPSQYIKSEVSYIKHWQVGRERIIAFRGFTGIALPYGNATSIPFTRSYYAGGSNDNRAWQAYKLGPGSSSGVNEFNEANFKLALNLEYRYPIIGPIKGAFFIDAGNIWNVNNNVPDVRQTLNSYRDLNQLAVGTGFGLRYDFDYFVFRLDTAFKTYDPSQAPEERWGSQIALDRAVFNVGINYPF